MNWNDMSAIERGVELGRFFADEDSSWEEFVAWTGKESGHTEFEVRRFMTHIEKRNKVEPGYFYWVKTLSDQEWTIAFLEDDMTFSFTNTTDVVDEVYDMQIDPIQPPGEDDV